MPRGSKPPELKPRAKQIKAGSKSVPTKRAVSSASKASNNISESPSKKARVLTKKAPARKTTPRKGSAERKAAVGKAPAKKTIAAKTAAVKAVAVKRSAVKRSDVKRSAVKRSAVKRSAVKRSATKAPAQKRSTAKKAPAPRGTGGKDQGLEKFWQDQQKALLAERESYEAQATGLKAEADQMAQDAEPGDIQFDEESGEGGTVNIDRERHLALSAQARAEVEEIDHALAKIGSGTYGICESCGQPIPRARLKALPQARICVACKSGGLSRR